ncbi:PTS cellobiose transporter subunit IIB [Phyllobacterium brassicacearum]|uniref:PTS cellobiose transporter subunit IIB n=1 Tax=Phyllobacterium brassicacearum TaxID=314235 RepID=A0A2P7B4R3_9HYPH|nr:PTS glucitol/sorbitol transporter subunit IIA [Phyllobacterium brassicacearum]PSH61452.1 PTS cellobiose transporter subunit IIB [Phyllobacterium brassicacearum]TDQ35206.1 PTS system glucitol/sorbitol-specific IIA component [Phyllobacterium brassicacearum]
MSVLLKTRVTAVGPEVADLAEGGVVILFADGAPPELAEVSILHSVEGKPSEMTPPLGSAIQIGDVSAKITGIGEYAWQKVRDIGHVVITFNGSETVERPGEICASEIDTEDLVSALKVGTTITIG